MASSVSRAPCDTRYTAVVTVQKARCGIARHRLHCNRHRTKGTVRHCTTHAKLQSSLYKRHGVAHHDTDYTAIVTVRKARCGTARHRLHCNRHCTKGTVWHCTTQTTLQSSLYQRYCTALYDTRYTAIITVQKARCGTVRHTLHCNRHCTKGNVRHCTRHATLQSSLYKRHGAALYDTDYIVIVTVQKARCGTVRHRLHCNRHCTKGTVWHCTTQTTLQSSLYERYGTALYDRHHTTIVTVRTILYGIVRQASYRSRSCTKDTVRHWTTDTTLQSSQYERYCVALYDRQHMTIVTVRKVS